jgi:hypothetical protein
MRQEESTDPAQPAPAPVGSVVGVMITGVGYLDEVTSPTLIREFRDKLRAAGSFSDQTDITWQPTPESDEFVRPFQIQVKLKEPMQL